MQTNIAAAVAICLALGTVTSSPLTGKETNELRLPEGFLIGAGTSSYQVEGAWNIDGKGVNIFDHYFHTNKFEASLTGDTAAGFYYRYKEDIDIAAELGLTTFRISVSWARIFPTGRNDTINKKGVQYYHNLLDYLRSKNIEPLVTLFHFEYPQTLHDEFRGWVGKQMPEVFAQFADYVFSEYGSKVKYWLTANEAAVYCKLAERYLPPFAVKKEEWSTCLHNLILGHALAHKIYEDKYKAKYNGLVGFGVGPKFERPASASEEDRIAAENRILGGETGIGVSIDPLIFGDYPDEAKSLNLPAFTEEEKRLIKDRIDWVGVNMYFGQNVSAGDTADMLDSIAAEAYFGTCNTTSVWTLRELPRWTKKRYGDLPVIFTESGCLTGSIDDWNTRAVFLSTYLRELVNGIYEDDNSVLGFVTWSFTDTFEFSGYGSRWGIVHVDYENGTLKRTPRYSAAFFKRMTRTWTVPYVERGSKPFTDQPDEPSGAASASILTRLVLVCFLYCARLHNFREYIL